MKHQEWEPGDRPEEDTPCRIIGSNLLISTPPPVILTEDDWRAQERAFDSRIKEWD